jgi:hypothetical protein
MPVNLESNLEAPADAEVAARHANARRWWHRAIAAVAVVLVVSPSLALLIWRVHVTSLRAENASYPPNAAGPPERIIKELYRTYQRTEGPTRRGPAFYQLLGWLQRPSGMTVRTCSEDELYFYCGKPDFSYPVQGGSITVVYYYASTRPRDSVAIVTLTTASPDQPRALKTIGFTTAAAFEATATTAPSSMPTTGRTTRP